MNKTLQLVFKNAENRNVSFNIADPVEPVVAADVTAVMDNILAKNIFLTSSGELISKVKATLIAREVTDIAVY